jgi:hypothetical protein
VIGAVCVRCGAARGDYAQICPSCGLQPEGDGLLVAWLLSAHHLDEARLRQAQERIRAGEVIRPSEARLAVARRALRTDFASDPGLGAGERLALLATSVLLTPLPGWVLWAWWRRSRPRAAFQALALSAPASVILFVAVIWLGLR